MNLSGVLSNVQLSFLAPLSALQPLIQKFEDRLLYPRGGVGFGEVFAELVQRDIDAGGLGLFLFHHDLEHSFLLMYSLTLEEQIFEIQVLY